MEEGQGFSWFPSSISLIRNLPFQPGKATFPVTGVATGLE